MPSYRKTNIALAGLAGCPGYILGYFTRDSYWFTPHTTRCHTCTSPDHISPKFDDQQPKVIKIHSAPAWRIPRNMWDDMRVKSEACSSTWWAGLPNQGVDRMWLKAIGNPSTEAENIMQCKVENMMKPFFDYVTKQNPYLTH